MCADETGQGLPLNAGYSEIGDLFDRVLGGEPAFAVRAERSDAPDIESDVDDLGFHRDLAADSNTGIGPESVKLWLSSANP